ncbi:hypothetical protein HGP14_26635 [Rhizobium sp. P32RR-XVIII]|uniref:hypothetical protein n=1 Tax=Rhizobium sp. P32RR-XVIII TaxID=2726738 RepID=UPI0014565990|nr:hypothetical protein [Rhizobium sp. P32RR-XVIII]NLS06887.1 hypothetical protein [Rhizobium sp. P32RR-XVIII]
MVDNNDRLKQAIFTAKQNAAQEDEAKLARDASMNEERQRQRDLAGKFQSLVAKLATDITVTNSQLESSDIPGIQLTRSQEPGASYVSLIMRNVIGQRAIIGQLTLAGDSLRLTFQWDDRNSPTIGVPPRLYAIDNFESAAAIADMIEAYNHLRSKAMNGLPFRE